ncbi:unnamed protein product [Heterobilharzia americana]|nr:unnamed protein product [Heterobilharzia americana]
MNFGNKLKHFPHHDKIGPCFTRPAYRDGRRKTAVKVFTVADESFYLLIFGVPSLGLEQPLKERFKQYGNVESLVKIVDYPDKEIFTDVFLVKYNNLRSARFAKRSADDSSFYGGSLHVCYAPEFETVADCRLKLYECRRLNARISRKAEHDYAGKFSSNCSVPTLELVPSILPSSCRSSTSLDIYSSSLPTSQNLALKPLSHDSTTQSTEAVTYPSCDALDDSRLYWRRFGVTLFDDLKQPIVNQSQSSNLTCSTYTTTSHLSLSSQHSEYCRLPVAQKRPIPLPVLQALSCRPYLENVSQSTEAPSSKKPSNTDKELKQYSPSSFIPRVLTRKFSQKKCISKPETSLQPSKSQTPISIGELKQLAYSLGPEQGPSLPPIEHTKQNCGQLKRIIFHRSALKQHKTNLPASEDN